MSLDAAVTSIDLPTSIEPTTITNYNTLPGQLESLSNELAIAAKALAKSLDISQDPKSTLGSTRRESAANRARQNAISILARLQTLLAEPTSFIERLANQVSRQDCTSNTVISLTIHLLNSSMPTLASNPVSFVCLLQFLCTLR